MVESFLIALLTLLVVLYAQARHAAREIRRHRQHTGLEQGRELVLKRRV